MTNSPIMQGQYSPLQLEQNMVALGNFLEFLKRIEAAMKAKTRERPLFFESLLTVVFDPDYRTQCDGVQPEDLNMSTVVMRYHFEDTFGITFANRPSVLVDDAAWDHYGIYG